MDYGSFTENLVRILEKNGYPENRVALPLEKLYESAYQKKLNFNKALEMLAARGISHEKTAQKIIFFPTPTRSSAPEANAFDPSSMMAEAMEMLRQLTPEQRQELEDKVLNMSAEDKAALLKKAKDMGFSP